MTAPTQPLNGAPAPSARRRFGWRSLLALAGVLAVIGAIPLFVGVVRRDREPEKPAPRAEALIHLDRSAPRIIEDPAFRESEADFALFRRTQVIVIKSAPTLWGALKRDDVKRLGLSDRGDPVAWLSDRLEVEEVPDSEIIRVSFRGDDATESVILANAIAEQYLADFNATQTTRLANRLVEMERQLSYSREELTHKRKACARVAEELGDRKSIQLDELREDIRADEETCRWLRRQFERQRLEAKAPPRVSLLQHAELH